MRKNARLILPNIILFLFFVIPFKVNALSFKTDYTSREQPTFYQNQIFEFETKSSDYLENGVRVNLKLKTINSEAYNFHYVIYCYDSENKEIGIKDGYSKIDEGHQETNLDIYLKTKNMYDSYLAKDMKYYKIFIEPATEEVVNDFTNYNKKQSSDVIDAIIDNNTSDMQGSSIYEDSDMPIANNGEYSISSYYIKIIVNEDNTFTITENLIAHYFIPKHGIFRKIPMLNTITRLDGTTSKNRARISGIEVNAPFTTSVTDGYKVIKVGDADKTLIGKNEYKINYLYDIGKDPLKDKDEVYFNIVGGEWDTSVENISFSIQMPKEFDASKLGFSLGDKGSTSSKGIEYRVDGNTITGTSKYDLLAGQSLTMRLELPEGYFVRKGFENQLAILMIIIGLLFLGITVYLWNKFGKDDPVVETVEFYPPAGYNSLELGYLYKGYCINNDIISLLIYLANKGYLKIEEYEKESLFSKSKSFKMIKLKEYDGNNNNEKIFFNGLFECGRQSKFKIRSKVLTPEMTSSSKDGEVVESDLVNEFYLTLKQIDKNMKNKEIKKSIIDSASTKYQMLTMALCVISFIIINAAPALLYNDIGAVVATMFMFTVICFLLFNAIFAKKGSLIKSSAGNKALSIINILVCLAIFAPFILAIWQMLLMDTLLQDTFLLVAYIIGIVCTILVGILSKHMEKRTKFGTEILGKIGGFKNFLETVEKEKLEELVLQDPTYFYNILPYTYVLGVSDKWIKKFETIAIEPPSWYGSPGAFNTVTFGSFMSNTMSSAAKAMSSSPSSSSSGGSSGGGFSGGGSGGGGGGSW